MQLCKVRLESGETRPAILEHAAIHLLKPGGFLGLRSLADLLHHDNPRETAKELLDDRARPIPFAQAIAQAKLSAPVDEQEIWAAGVTYKRSQEARERESVGAARFYDLVYTAERPELFFKAPASRVRGPGESVHIRRDSRWSVPEPELTLVISPKLKLVGYTIGNDMSARDIEGENPLYLPQAKFYDHSCAIGPVITLADAMPPLPQVTISLVIERQKRTAFEGTTTLGAMARSFADLIAWMRKETSFPQGALLLTGTGIVPPDDFTLQAGDLVHIDVAGIGRLTNPVEQRS